MLQSAPEQAANTDVPKVFEGAKSYGLATELADKHTESGIISGRFRREVTVHSDPSDHDDATRYIDAEYALASKLRDALSADFSSKALALESDLRAGLNSTLAACWTVRRGAVAAADGLLQSIIGHFEALQRGLAAVNAAPPVSLANVKRKHGADPGLIGRWKVDASKRMIDFRTDLESSFVQELKAQLARELSSAIARVRTDADQLRRTIAELQDRGEVLRSDYKQVATEFLGNHRKHDSALVFQHDAVGDVEIATDEYKEDRLGLLNKCRADLNPSSLLGSLEKPRVDLHRFVQDLYKIVSKYIFENKSRAQLFDHSRLRRGLDEAQINLHLRHLPHSQSRRVNWLFVPPDDRLRKEVEDVFNQSAPAGSAQPQVFPSVDENVLTYLQFVTHFELKELADIQHMQQSYDARKRSQKIFLDLPTHQRRPIVESVADTRPKELLAFGIMLGVLKEAGQNYKIGDRYLLASEITDKSERRREAYKAIVDPDRSRKIEEERRKASDAGNQDFGARIEKFIADRYSDLNPEDDYEKLLIEERQALEKYLDSLGIRRRAASTR